MPVAGDLPFYMPAFWPNNILTVGRSGQSRIGPFFYIIFRKDVELTFNTITDML